MQSLRWGRSYKRVWKYISLFYKSQVGITYEAQNKKNKVIITDTDSIYKKMEKYVSLTPESSQKFDRILCVRQYFFLNIRINLCK